MRQEKADCWRYVGDEHFLIFRIRFGHLRHRQPRGRFYCKYPQAFPRGQVARVWYEAESERMSCRTCFSIRSSLETMIDGRSIYQLCC